MAHRLLSQERVRCRPRLPLVLVASAMAIALPRAARAADGPRIELAANVDPAMSWTVRNLASSGADTTVLVLYSISGAVLVGPVLAGVNVGAAGGWISSRLETFAGGFVGSELFLDRTLLLAVAEGGMHWVESAGNDSSYLAQTATAELPFVGMRIALEKQMIWQKRTLSLGASAFLRADLGREQVSGTLSQRCAFGDFDCDTPPIPSSFEVGGLMVGAGISLTWGSDR